MAQDVAEDVAEDVLGAAEDGSVTVLILPIAICRGGREREGAYLAHRHLPAAEPTPSSRMPPPTLALG